jgi:hypothetical protein
VSNLLDLLYDPSLAYPDVMHWVLYNAFPVVTMCLLMKRKWRVLCWNVRGLNSEDKQREVRSKIEESECDIVCLQETKCASFD